MNRIKLLFKDSLAVLALIASLMILVALAINVIHSFDTLSLLLSHTL